ncbi:MAG: hypothetical protein JWQ25_680 [Daejeonella sp.]|nr:hypothetical protein [Daejeonella sp.]
MKAFIFTALFFLTTNVFAQSNLNLGVGVLEVNIDALPTLSFFSDTLTAKPTKRVTIVKNANNEFSLNSKVSNSWLAPEGLWLDYSIFTFRCSRKLGNWCEVYVNNANHAKFWIKLNRNLLYHNWTKYLATQATWIGKRAEYSVSVKAFPTENSKTIKMMEKDDCFVVLQVKGDWMKIQTSEVLDCSSSKFPVRSGWIRWRNNNKLLVEYGLIC